MSIVIRPLADEDIPDVVHLWHDVGLTRPWNDPHEDIRRARSVWPDLLLIAEDRQGAGLVGTVMAGYDGHRGWLSYLASAPGRRGEGIGRALVAEAEVRLTALGCPKVMLMVRAENDAVIDYYRADGYAVNDVAVLGKRLIPDE